MRMRYTEWTPVGDIFDIFKPQMQKGFIYIVDFYQIILKYDFHKLLIRLKRDSQKQ